MSGTTTKATTSATVEGLLRLAWEAEAEGRPRLHDALLTLVVAESGPDDAVLAERCRRRLVARQPDHWYATTATLGQILANERVAKALAKLRATFPPVRVQRHLLRFNTLRGAFEGGQPPLERVLQDLHLAPTRRRPPAEVVPERTAPTSSTSGGRDRSRGGVRALPFPGRPEASGSGTDSGSSNDPDGSVAAMYLSVLLAMAVLLQGVMEQEEVANDSRAA
jgi:hypothetical protein